MDIEDEERAIDQLRTELAHTFPLIPRPRVEATIDTTWRQYANASVRDFVPLLVQRQAARELRDASRAG